MNKKLIIFMLVLVSFLTGCATGYQPSGFGGGYSEMPLAENIYKVSYRGNGFTSQDQVQSYLLRRCAEITLVHNYDYFVIIAGNTSAASSSFQTPSTVTSSTTGAYRASRFGGNYSNTYGNESSNTYSTINYGQSYIINKITSVAIIKMLKSKKNFPDALDASVILFGSPRVAS